MGTTDEGIEFRTGDEDEVDTVGEGLVLLAAANAGDGSEVVVIAFEVGIVDVDKAVVIKLKGGDVVGADDGRTAAAGCHFVSGAATSRLLTSVWVMKKFMISPSAGTSTWPTVHPVRPQRQEGGVLFVFLWWESWSPLASSWTAWSKFPLL